MLHGRDAGSHEGATVLDTSTISNGLPHHYLHENLISRFSGEQLLAVFITCGCISAHPHHPRKFIRKMQSNVFIISLGTRAKYFFIQCTQLIQHTICSRRSKCFLEGGSVTIN